MNLDLNICTICKSDFIANSSPSKVLKLILSYLCSKNLIKEAIKIKRKINKELLSLRRIYKRKIKYSDNTKDIPICKKCIKRLFRSNLKGNIRKIVLQFLDKILG